MSDIGRKRSWIGLIVAVVICFGVAGVGSIATTSGVPGWYATLAKPSWTPPGWVFGPVWTVLYLAMAVAAWLVWREGGLRANRMELTLFGVQLALNGLWSWLFFGLERPSAAAVEILLLWLAIAATTVVFWRRSLAAGVLLAPYLAWVSFAVALNWAIWRLNA